MKSTIYLILTVWIIAALSGCSTAGQHPFAFKSLAKTDVDMMADANCREIDKLLRKLTLKLYRRNPRELAKGGPYETVDSRMQQIFVQSAVTRFAELNNSYGTSTIPLAFDPEFGGDRVFALMTGIRQMLYASYGYRNDFYISNELDGQKLFNSARNLEAISWRLNNKRDASGHLFLLSNGYSEDGVANFSYARIFGKLIAYQEMLAYMMADKNNRTIKNVVVSVASTALLPI
ncbi:hypothetical protein [Celerinatantimonas sp. YJH-8]|uniref:hypothetical protein n=1 Tax=Celerinatantimonas sp. YJH-8 TaxID=3228714 RepID=UPI0038CAE01A